MGSPVASDNVPGFIGVFNAVYMQGLLDDARQKNVETLALSLDGPMFPVHQPVALAKPAAARYFKVVATPAPEFGRIGK